MEQIMPVSVQLPNVLAKQADGHRTIETTGETVGDVVTNLVQRFPALESRLRDEHGAPYRFVTFYLNNEDIRLGGGFEKTTADGDELIIVPAVAGG
jgi:molybdopterin converting factor small subunit